MRAKARRLRAASTDAEQRLWYHLRNGRFLNFKFKRQEPLGHYIVDFLCAQCKLVIELDGSQHLDNQDYDSQRTSWLTSQGYRVLRFWNDDLLLHTQQVLDQIYLATTPAVPSPTGEGGPTGPGEGQISNYNDSQP